MKRSEFFICIKLKEGRAGCPLQVPSLSQALDDPPTGSSHSIAQKSVNTCFKTENAVYQLVLFSPATDS